MSYAVVSWLILQVGALVFPMFGINQALLRWVFVALAVGLPVWIVFAYIYELTPEGFKKTDEVDAEESIRSNTGKKLNAYIIAGLSLAVILLVFDRFYKIDVSLDNELDRSVAVLQFENVSASEDAYFAQGMTEDILTQISKIGDIRVLSSLSLRDYDSKGKTVKQIGDELGVTHILMGNVRRSENDFRIGCQLIDTASESAIWAQTFDKKMSNLFAMQTEIAKEIASSLNATISNKEEKVIDNIPTENMEAYDKYLKGRAIISSGKETDVRKENYYKEAISLDPFFANAYASLSSTYSLGIYDHGSFSRDFLDTAYTMAQKSLDLNPELSSAWHALGLYYTVTGKGDEAVTMYQKVLELNPNSAGAYNNLSIYLEREGNIAKAITYLKKAISLKRPNSPELHTEYSNLSNIYWQLGMTDRSIAAAEKSLAIEDDPLTRVHLAVASYIKRDTLRMYENLERILELDPDSPVNLSFYVTMNFEFLGNEKGKLYLEELKAAENYDIRDFPFVNNYDALLALQKGNVDQADQLLDQNLDFYLSEMEKGVQFQNYLYEIASIYAIQDEQDKAVKWLNTLVDDGYINVYALEGSRLFDNLHDNEGFNQIINRLYAKKDSLRAVVI